MIYESNPIIPIEKFNFSTNCPKSLLKRFSINITQQMIIETDMKKNVLSPLAHIVGEKLNMILDMKPRNIIPTAIRLFKEFSNAIYNNKGIRKAAEYKTIKNK